MSTDDFKRILEQSPEWLKDPVARTPVKGHNGPRFAADVAEPVVHVNGTFALAPAKPKLKSERSSAPHSTRAARKAAERPPNPYRRKSQRARKTVSLIVADDPGADQPERSMPPKSTPALTPADRAARYVNYVRQEIERTEHVLWLEQLDKENPEEATQMQARDAERLAQALAWNGEGSAPEFTARRGAVNASPPSSSPLQTPVANEIHDTAPTEPPCPDGILDRGEAARFLALLDPTATRFTFQTFDDNSERESKRLAGIQHGSLDECFPALVRLNNLGAGIFVTINATDFNGRTNGNIVRVRALFADFDNGAALPQDGPQPFITVQSSETGRHAYWKTNGIALDAFTATQELIIKRFGSDPKIKDLPRVMRLPGFFHRKGPPFMTRILEVHEDAPACTTADFGTVSTDRDEIPPWITAVDAGLGVDDQHDSDPWRELNSRALANLAKWVPALFGETAVYQTGTGAYRVSSEALGRDLEEDLSIHPTGIVDFGVADQGDEREGKRSPIDIVMEFRDVDEDEAFDWLDAQLHDENAQPAGANSNDASAKNAQDAELDEWDAGELLSGPLPSPRQWLIGGIFCRTFLSGLVAPGDVGKTTLRLTQAIELATGRELLGLRVYQRCKVLVLSFEDDRAELHRRLLAICQHHGIDPGELKGGLFCRDLNGGAKLAELDAKGRRRQIGRLDGMLRRAIKRTGCDLVVLDPFVKIHALNENDNPDMDFVCSALIRIAQDCGIAVDSPAHTHKGQIQAGDADARRGGSAQRDAGRLDYTLTVMTEDEAKAFGIVADERKRFMRLDKAKANIVRAIKARWFRLVSVRLNNADSVYVEGDEVQAIERWEPPETWAGIEGDTLNAILNDLDAGTPNGRRYSKHGAATDRAAWKVVQKHCPAKTEAQCREIIKQWCEAGTLFEETGHDPVSRKDEKGLYVNPSKRPHYD
jgi:hypothetical protein